MSEKERFIDLLLKTGRAGMDRVLAGLEELGFFTAPASTRFHGAVPGGLLTHSLNVYDEACVIRESQLRFRPELETALPLASIAIAALLHDVCKAEIYQVVEKFRKDKNGQWERYQAYSVDHSALPLGHGEKSVIRLLRWGLDLTEDEMLAIRWHMNAWDLSDSPEARASLTTASDKCPLLAVIIAADGLASRILETR